MCWTNLLSDKLSKQVSKVWINNAGFQGHSTYGNLILVNEHIKLLKPKYVLLMEGINEINRNDIRVDESVSRSNGKTTWWGWLKRNSFLVSTVINIQRHYMADRLGVTDGYLDLKKADTLSLSARYMDSAVQKQLPLVEAYAGRLIRIIDTCIVNGIQPILVTQPISYGEGKDCVTSTDLAHIKVTDKYNSELVWKLLELYNSKTRDIARERNILLVDAERKMPKCSRYFYDVCHFTNQGSEKLASILEDELATYLKNR